MEQTENAVKSRGYAFVAYCIERIQKDNGFAAALRRADNPATEYQSWEYLANWCDLAKPWELLPFATVAAAVARAKPKQNGSLKIGQALTVCYSDGGANGRENDSAKMKMRRLLACENTAEVCRIIRPILQLLASRGIGMDFGGLLDDLLYFNERVKQNWAMSYYGRRPDDSIDVQP